MNAASKAAAENGGFRLRFNFQPRKWTTSRTSSDWKSSVAELCFNKWKGQENWWMGWMFAAPHSSSSATKSKKKRSSRLQQRQQATKWQLMLPHVLSKNKSIPHVPCAINYPWLSKLLLLSNFNSKRISNLNLKSTSVLLPLWTQGTARSELRNWRISTRNRMQAGYTVLRRFLRRPCRNET